jgi:glycosyltransferase involved in cell wall biosynthesis
MKILMVIDSLGKGGKERRMLELIKGLIRAENHFDIFLVILSENIEYKHVYELPIKLEVLIRKFKKDPTIPFKLKKIISRFNPDIIHSWSTMSSVYLSISNLFSRIPFINAVLADAPLHLNIFDKQYFRVKLTTPFTDLFISNSKAGILSYKTPKKKSVCIYNGIDFGRFENLRPANDLRSEILGDKSNELFVIAMVATFNERKDYETLINTAVRMCSNNPLLVFLLVGSGPTLQQLKDKVADKYLNNRQIIFTGKRDDVESLLQIIDIGVLISNSENHREGVSNSIIEMMASGKPVIASRGGGTDEVVKDNFNGYLIDPHNEKQLAEKIESLFINREHLRVLGENARKYVMDNFELGKKTSEYINLYKSLTQKAGRKHTRDKV